MQGSRGAPDGDALISVFDRIAESMEKRRREFARQNAGPYDLCRRLIGFQHVMHDTAWSRHKDESKGYVEGTPVADEIRAELAILDTLGQNKLSLLSALHALAGGSVHAAGSLVRPVFESVPKSFYLMARPQTAKMFMLLEAYRIWNASSPSAKLPGPIKSFMESPETQEFLGGDRVAAGEFKKFRDTHKIGDIRERVYDGETLDRQKQTYAVLSFSSHAGVLRGFTSSEPGVSKRFMEITAELSFANLFLTANSQSRLLESRGLSESAELMRGALQDMAPKYRFADMYPSDDLYTGGLSVTLGSLS